MSPFIPLEGNIPTAYFTSTSEGIPAIVYSNNFDQLEKFFNSSLNENLEEQSSNPKLIFPEAEILGSLENPLTTDEIQKLISEENHSDLEKKAGLEIIIPKSIATLVENDNLEESIYTWRDIQENFNYAAYFINQFLPPESRKQMIVSRIIIVEDNLSSKIVLNPTKPFKNDSSQRLMLYSANKASPLFFQFHTTINSETKKYSGMLIEIAFNTILDSLSENEIKSLIENVEKEYMTPISEQESIYGVPYNLYQKKDGSALNFEEFLLLRSLYSKQQEIKLLNGEPLEDIPQISIREDLCRPEYESYIAAHIALYDLILENSKLDFPNGQTFSTHRSSLKNTPQILRIQNEISEAYRKVNNSISSDSTQNREVPISSPFNWIVTQYPIKLKIFMDSIYQNYLPLELAKEWYPGVKTWFVEEDYREVSGYLLPNLVIKFPNGSKELTNVDLGLLHEFSHYLTPELPMGHRSIILLPSSEAFTQSLISQSGVSKDEVTFPNKPVKPEEAAKLFKLSTAEELFYLTGKFNSFYGYSKFYGQLPDGSEGKTEQEQTPEKMIIKISLGENLNPIQVEAYSIIKRYSSQGGEKYIQGEKMPTSAAEDPNSIQVETSVLKKYPQPHLYIYEEPDTKNRYKIYLPLILQENNDEYTPKTFESLQIDDSIEQYSLLLNVMVNSETDSKTLQIPIPRDMLTAYYFFSQIFGESIFEINLDPDFISRYSPENSKKLQIFFWDENLKPKLGINITKFGVLRMQSKEDPQKTIELPIYARVLY